MKRRVICRAVVRAVLMTLCVLGWICVANGWGKPAHARGTAQPLLAAVNGVGDLLSAPGRRIAIKQSWRPGMPRPYEIPVGLSNAWNAALYFVFFLTGNLLLQLRRKPRGVPETLRLDAELLPSRSDRQDPPQEEDEPISSGNSDEPASANPPISRRAFLRITPARAVGAVAAAGIIGAGAHGFLLEPNRLPVTFRRFPLRGLPPELAGLRIVHLTDLHHGPWLSVEFLARVVAKTNALKSDLVLITGDHIVGGSRYTEPVASALAGLRPRIGVLSTLGNHDWWGGVGKIRDAFRRAELPLIDNSRRFLSPDRRLTDEPPRSGIGLCLAGVGDFWEDQTDFAGALRPAPDSMPRIVLCHNPDAAESMALLNARERIDLMLCGHTHGGQIRLPLVGSPVVPSQYGQKYARGLVQGPACPVFISRGIGMTVLPVRFGVPPEIAVIELYPQPA